MKKVSTLIQTVRRVIDFNVTDRIRRLIAFSIALAALNLSLPLLPSVFASGLPTPPLAAGKIRVAGIVEIDGVRATSAQIIFPGSHITTSEESESIIDLGKLTRLRLSATTEFTLDFTRVSISSSLIKGGVRGYIPAGMPVTIKCAGRELVTDPSQPAVFRVEADHDAVKVSVDEGRVEVVSDDERQTVGPGEALATGTSAQTEPDSDEGLTKRQKVGLFVAIGAAATILAIAIMGRDEEELEFGDCVIVPSGEQSSICP